MHLRIRIKNLLRHLPAAQVLVIGFALVILSGAILLWLPVSLQPGVRITFMEALFESTSAVCVTGLTVVPVGNTFNFFGRLVMAVLIQIGGMGVVLLGVMLIIAAGGRMGFRSRSLFVQAQNLYGYADIYLVAKRIIIITFGIELVGALLCFFCFLPYYPMDKAAGYALFHSISAFNNAGFDIFGGFDSMIPFADDVPLNLVTSALVILGGFGFLAMMDLFRCRFHWKRMMLTTKIVLSMTAVLLISGTVMFKICSDCTWLQAWFQSVITRTAGFSTMPMTDFVPAGLLVFIVLMFIGASPNSTGGGVKTTTVFVAALKAFSSTCEHDEDSVFYRRVPEIVFTKAFTVLFFGFLVVLTGSLLMMIADPQLSLVSVLVEVTSAFATVGSSMGITASLSEFSRVVLILCMFIGRVGPVTIANLLVTRNQKEARFTEESVLIG